MSNYDYLIVGAGLYGSTFARLATDSGKKCLVIDKRNHVAGNIYTESVDGINVHVYGAHIFHTSNREVWDFAGKFCEFNRYTNSPIANYKGEIFSMPFNMYTFNKMWGVVTPEEAAAKIEEQRRAAGITEPQNLEEQAISLVGTDIYEKLIKGYTEKQWGRPCNELPAFIIKRLPVRLTFDNNYFNALYQGIPVKGYTKLVENMLDGIEVKLGANYLEDKDALNAAYDKVIYTGPVDAYFDYTFGPLKYRSVRFENEVLDIPNFQGNAVINYGDKTTEKTDVLNVDDYFLRTITEIKLKARNTRFDDVDVDPENIPASYSYIFGYASKYFPKTAVDVQLTVESSSNEGVVAVEKGMFKIVGEGTAELTFSYFQKIDGIYEKAYKYATVTITAMKVESISFGNYETNMYQQYGLSTSLTYDWPINISPYKASAEITAVSSNEDVLKVSIVKDREIRITPVGEGTATITITSVNNPNATASKEFYVLNPELDITKYLCSHTFEHPSPYGYTFTMKFNADGTGTRHRVTTSTGDTRDDTFKYTVEGNKVKFSNFSSASLDDNSYVRGTVVKYLDRAGKPMGIYCETNAKGQPFYEI